MWYGMIDRLAKHGDRVGSRSRASAASFRRGAQHSQCVAPPHLGQTLAHQHRPLHGLGAQRIQHQPANHRRQRSTPHATIADRAAARHLGSRASLLPNHSCQCWQQDNIDTLATTQASHTVRTLCIVSPHCIFANSNGSTSCWMLRNIASSSMNLIVECKSTFWWQTTFFKRSCCFEPRQGAGIAFNDQFTILLIQIHNAVDVRQPTLQQLQRHLCVVEACNQCADVNQRVIMRLGNQRQQRIDTPLPLYHSHIAMYR
mmetsp:Transcript_721/g.1114  ORF Transcript_721/g.1114 Transcript_721/m.1114 type:complete len:258 (-) Transcript_721:1431-2204(-)